MGTLVYLKETGASVPPGQKILRAGEYAALREANAVLAQAQADAEALRAQAREVYAAEKLRGYAEGMVQGKAEMAERMMHSIVSSVDSLEKMENMMVDVVMSALRKILDGIDHGELAAGLVRKALSYVRGQKKVILRISPDDLEAVQAVLQDITQGKSDIGILEIAPDARLERGACLLESDLGLIDASLDVQLESIRSAFSQHLGSGLSRV